MEHDDFIREAVEAGFSNSQAEFLWTIIGSEDGDEEDEEEEEEDEN